MTRIYYHRLVVHVITTIESPDAIERMIDGSSTSDCRIDARTDPDNRRNGPSKEIGTRPDDYPDPPTVEAINLYYDAVDAWRDTWPTVEDFTRTYRP